MTPRGGARAEKHAAAGGFPPPTSSPIRTGGFLFFRVARDAFPILSEREKVRLRRATNVRLDVSLAKLRQTTRVFSTLRVHQDGDRAKLQSQRGTPERGRRIRGTRVRRRREGARRVRRVGERRARDRIGA